MQFTDYQLRLNVQSNLFLISTMLDDIHGRATEISDTFAADNGAVDVKTALGGIKIQLDHLHSTINASLTLYQSHKHWLADCS